jgi:hypothetical protein
MATVAEVYDGTLELLGVLSLGKTISANDSARMARAYNQVYDDLKFSGLDAWASAGPVPDRFVQHVEALMAFNSLDTYSVSQARYQRISNKYNMAKREIRRLSISDYESLDEPVDY